MTESLSFTVAGIPRPKGSHTAVVDRAGRARVLEGRNTTQRQMYAGWRDTVAQEAWVAMAKARRRTPFRGPVAVRLTFVMPRPKSAKAAARWHTVRPDADKLLRLIGDALTASAVIGDDCQIASLHVDKVLAGSHGDTPGVHVTVSALAHDECPVVVAIDARTSHTEGAQR